MPARKKSKTTENGFLENHLKPQKGILKFEILRLQRGNGASRVTSQRQVLAMASKIVETSMPLAECIVIWKALVPSMWDASRTHLGQRGQQFHMLNISRMKMNKVLARWRTG